MFFHCMFIFLLWSTHYLPFYVLSPFLWHNTCSLFSIVLLWLNNLLIFIFWDIATPPLVWWFIILDSNIQTIMNIHSSFYYILNLDIQGQILCYLPINCLQTLTYNSWEYAFKLTRLTWPSFINDITFKVKIVKFLGFLAHLST